MHLYHYHFVLSIIPTFRETLILCPYLDSPYTILYNLVSPDVRLIPELNVGIRVIRGLACWEWAGHEVFWWGIVLCDDVI